MRDLDSFTVVKGRNRHGTMMLRAERSTNRTVFVVECADDDVRGVLERAAVGSEVKVDLERVGRRGNSWRAVAAERAETAERAMAAEHAETVKTTEQAETAEHAMAAEQAGAGKTTEQAETPDR
jgi:hypothetical protein